MARRRAEEHANHERWLISYADFITLLFAFFVVMFASSQADKSKAQAVSDSVRAAIDKGAQSSPATKAMVKSPAAKGNVISPEMSRAAMQLRDALAEEVSSGKVSIELEQRGLVVSLRQGAFFPSGGDTVAPESYGALGKLAATLNQMPDEIQLEGHTDSKPIHNERFHNNWDLSTARSIAMLEVLSTRYAVDRSRFGVAGYADIWPVDSNDTEDGRAHNRRVDVVLLSHPRETERADKARPGPGPPR